MELEPECLSHCYRYNVLSLRDRRYVTIATEVRKFVTEILKLAKYYHKYSNQNNIITIVGSVWAITAYTLWHDYWGI